MRGKCPERLYYRIALRAMESSLHERLIDQCWHELKKVFENPEVQKAEAIIMRAIAEAFSPTPLGIAPGSAKPKKSRRRSAKPAAQ
jgi:hypothetical protein